MMKGFLLVVMISCATGVIAQEKWAVTFRPTLNFPTRKVLENKLRVGNGLEVTAERAVGEKSLIYAGLTWGRFDLDNDFDELDIEFIQKGFSFGGIYSFRAFSNQYSPFYIRAGFLLEYATAISEDANSEFKTDWAIGSQLGLGIKIKVSDHWLMLPEVRYNNITYPTDRDNLQRLLSFVDLSFTIGVLYAF